MGSPTRHDPAGSLRLVGAGLLLAPSEEIVTSRVRRGSGTLTERRMVPMPRSPRLPRTPACPECDRPGRYVWQEEAFRDAYVCVTPSCPADRYQHGRSRSCQAVTSCDG
jgi:hypothetical protein